MNTFQGHDLQGRGQNSQAPSPPYFPLGERARPEAATDSALGKEEPGDGSSLSSRCRLPLGFAGEVA